VSGCWTTAAGGGGAVFIEKGNGDHCYYCGGAVDG